MPESETPEKAIEVLEANRLALGNDVVDAAIAALRARAVPAQQRKLVTVLFADVSGSTAMADGRDAEDTTAVMNDLWERLDPIVLERGGRIDKHIGDALMAIWGADAAREDDPARAVQAALAMQAQMVQFRAILAERGLPPLALRVGVNTGEALLGRVGKTAEFTAMGDTVNVASRLEHAAPIGGVLVGADTWAAIAIQGRFQAVEQEPLAAKGKAAPLRTWVVTGAAPRGMRARGGDAATVGREAERGALRSAWDAAVRGEPGAVLILGEAGLGKSRLLADFERELGESPLVLRARAAPEYAARPYGLLGELLREHLGIEDADDPAQVRAKLHAGLSTGLTTDEADLVGHLIGFDLSGATAVAALSGTGALVPNAIAALSAWLRSLADGSRAVCLLLEDLHWADPSSLDHLEGLIASAGAARLLLVATARPELRACRPDLGWWCLELKPLSSEATAELCDRLLARVESLPAELRRIIVASAEGNPFYVEELIRMMIDREVIVARGERWTVAIEKLVAGGVPATLTGVLQARLDALSPEDRDVVQRASVVGRRFWDEVVAELIERAPAASLGVAAEHGLIAATSEPTFEGSAEWSFRHALLRDVAYGGVLRKVRRALHARVARWLRDHAGERVAEHASVIAWHFEEAGELDEAVAWYVRVGRAAREAEAYVEAHNAFRRAVTLDPRMLSARHGLADALWMCGELGPAAAEARRALDDALDAGDTQLACELCAMLTRVLALRGELDDALAAGRRAVRLAQAAGTHRAHGLAENALAYALQQMGDSAGARAALGRALEEWTAEGDEAAIARVRISLGALAVGIGDFAAAEELLIHSAEYFRALRGHRFWESEALGNLGALRLLAGDLVTGREHSERAVSAKRALGDRAGEIICLNNVGYAALGMGDAAAACAAYRDVLAIARDIGAWPNALEAIAGLAGVARAGGDVEEAARLAGLALRHPRSTPDVQLQIRPTLERLGVELGAALDRLMSEGAGRVLEDEVARLI